MNRTLWVICTRRPIIILIILQREHQVQTKCHNLAKEHCHLHSYQHINQPQQLNHTCLSSTRKDSMESLTLSEKKLLYINFK
jgi:hypothetical protein